MTSRSAKAKSRGKKLTLNKRTLKDLSARSKGAAGVRGGGKKILTQYCQVGGGVGPGNGS